MSDTQKQTPPQPLAPQPEISQPNLTSTTTVPPTTNQPVATVTPPVDPPKKSKGKIIVGVIAAIVVVLIVAIAGIFIGVNKATAEPQKVSDQFVTFLQKDDAQSAYNILLPEFKQTTDQPTLQSFFDRLSPFVSSTPQITTKKISTSNTDGTIAVFVYVVKSTPPFYIKVEVKKTDSGTWEIFNFRTSQTSLDSTVE